VRILLILFNFIILIVNACKVTDIRFPPLVDVCDSFAMIGLYVVFEDVFFSHSCCYFPHLSMYAALVDNEDIKAVNLASYR